MAALPYRALTVGISFGVVRVRDHVHQGVEVEVATFRSDGAYVDGRRPQSVVFSSSELDAARRDFTINGMFMDPLSGEVIDFVGGQADLKNRVLRAIGDPSARLREDRLRCLCAVRLAARFHLQIEPATFAALRAIAPQINSVSAERIAQELRRMLVHSSRASHEPGARDWSGRRRPAAPLANERAVPGQAGSARGRPVGPHDARARSAPARAQLHPRLRGALARLRQTRDEMLHRGRYAFHHHEQAGARIADRLCLSLKLSNVERERITWLVAHHQYLGEARNLRESKLKRILAAPGIEELLALHEADALASFGSSEEVEYCRRYLESEPSGPINPPPLINGHDLVRRGLQPGPHFAALLGQLRDAQLEGTIHNKHEALEWVEPARSRSLPARLHPSPIPR